MLFDSLDKIKRNAIFSAILLIALGAVILLCPETYVPTMILGFGYTLVIIAIVMMLNFFSSKKSLMDYVKFIGGLALAVGGGCVLVYRDDTMKVLAWLFGFMLVLDGCRTLIHSFTFARRSQRKAWWVLTILSAFMMLAGVMLFLNPWVGTPIALRKVIGAAILFSAIVSALRLIWTWPVKKEKGGNENG